MAVANIELRVDELGNVSNGQAATISADFSNKTWSVDAGGDPNGLLACQNGSFSAIAIVGTVTLSGNGATQGTLSNFSLQQGNSGPGSLQVNGMPTSIAWTINSVT
jgi:hypothetical protein